MSQRLLLIDDYVNFVVVVVVVVIAVVAVVADAAAVAAAEFVVVVLVLFVVAAVVSDFEVHDCDSAVAWDSFLVFADYFGYIDDDVETAVCRLHLGVLADIGIFSVKVSYKLLCKYLSFHQEFY